MMGKILTFYIVIRNRLREPSSMAAISAVMLSVGVQVDQGVVHDWLTVLGIGFAGLVCLSKSQKLKLMLISLMLTGCALCQPGISPIIAERPLTVDGIELRINCNEDKNRSD